jgi:hypothetical protein
LDRSDLERTLTNRPRPRPRFLELERSQPVGSIDWGFFDPAAVPHLQIKIEDEDDNRKPRRREPSRALRMA